MRKLQRCIKAMVLAIAYLVLSFHPASATNATWHTKPRRYETLGSDVNNYYHVVGLPKNCICQIMAAQPAYSEHGHDFFGVSGLPMFCEIEYTDDRQTIRRFRFIANSSNSATERKYGGWQTENSRKNPSDFTTSESIVDLALRGGDPFAMPFATMMFTSEHWNNDKLHRPWFLFDIAHSYPIIGMNRSEITNILGAADYLPAVPSSTEYPEYDCVDQYILRRGCMGINSVFEIAYIKDKAVAYRVDSPSRNR